MWFLENEAEFEKWKADHDTGVTLYIPEEFPCFVYLIVTDWGMQEEATQYLYRSSLDHMLIQIESAQQSVQQTNGGLCVHCGVPEWRHKSVIGHVFKAPTISC